MASVKCTIILALIAVLALFQPISGQYYAAESLYPGYGGYYGSYYNGLYSGVYPSVYSPSYGTYGSVIVKRSRQLNLPRGITHLAWFPVSGPLTSGEKYPTRSKNSGIRESQMAVFCGKRLADPNGGCHIESEATRHSTKRPWSARGNRSLVPSLGPVLAWEESLAV
ncbi:unnamed protein product [Caenorhabditis auriculariae]|uniref:Uncharacterized protein n=1 Tax=Caenorhabditis auriculariae TaxID=2777116 RepID=A0A8S1HVL2_9PELO|nr:unnamed protein product [Caenorhabditis auriculariae]